MILYAKNAPEWSMAFFGVLKAGGTVVPVAHDSTTAELVNIARASGAVGLIVGEDLLEKRPDLPAALAKEGLPTRLWPFETVFALPPLAVEEERKRALHSKHGPDTVASLIFTSGTTGHPKGVMLTHRNFTFMVSELLRTFDLGPTDGMLSVLPLAPYLRVFDRAPGPAGARGAHHLPARADRRRHQCRAQDRQDHRHRGRARGVGDAASAGPAEVLRSFCAMESLVNALTRANFELRSRTGIDLGMFVFFPVHKGFGGRVRYMISGGSSLPPEVLKTFYGMGFDFFEGYGLTETAPVLSVTTPKKKPVLGSVGQPLPGVEVKIDSPDASGVGEVIARGRNVMAGYWENPEATAQAIRDGWFYTGDLGRFDEDGNLFIVGRSKDVIIDTNGKNVYPDEVEDLYRNSPLRQGALGGRPARRRGRARGLRGGAQSGSRAGAFAGRGAGQD